MDELRNDEMQDEELERYGVWVKAGPEEVVEADEDYSLSDLAEDSEPIGTDVERDLDDGGDTTDMPSLDEFDDISLDDLDFGEDEETPAAEPDTPPEAETAPSLEDDAEELTIDDSTQDGEDLVSLDDFDLDVPEEDPDPFETLAEDEESTGTTASESTSAPEDLDLEALEDELPDDFEELDLDASEAVDADDQSEPEEFDSYIPGSDGELDGMSLDDISVEDSTEDLPELEVDSVETAEHDFTPEDQGIEIENRSPSNQISPDEEEFLSDESDLQNESESAIPTSMDLQEREAFERIQTELTDIKKELAELKTALRGAGTSAAGTAPPAAEQIDDDFDLPPAAPEPASDESVADVGEADEEASQAPGTGFFEDEEDETIALTGDELDNILNTAEFTEQAGEAVELEDDFIVEPDQPEGIADEQDEPAAEDHESTIGEPEDTEVESIELEPVDRDSVVFEGDQSAVDELAEMDIDSELADIDSLEDTTDDDSHDSDELEIDLDGIEDVDTSDVLEESAEAAAEENAAELDQQALETDIDDLDDLQIDDLDLEDESEPEIDSEQETATEAEPEGFDQFAAAVEEDIASADSGVQLDDQFDEESELGGEPEPAEAADDDEEHDEIEIELDDIDGVDDLDDLNDLTDLNEFNAEEVGGQEPAIQESSTISESSAAESAPVPETAPAAESAPGTQGESSVDEDHPSAQSAASISDLPDDLKQEIRSVLSYMDQLLEALPDDKIEEFAHSEHFEVYKKLFEELGLET